MYDGWDSKISFSLFCGFSYEAWEGLDESKCWSMKGWGMLRTGTCCKLIGRTDLSLCVPTGHKYRSVFLRTVSMSWGECTVLSATSTFTPVLLNNLSLFTLFHITIILFFSESHFSFSITIKDFTSGLNFSFAIDVLSHKMKWGFMIAVSSWAAQILHIKWIIIISLSSFGKQLPCTAGKKSCNLETHGFFQNSRFFWTPLGNI